MKRPWLTASLISVIGVIGAAGIHHEARMELIRGLSSFQAALPPGTTFTYGSARPAILSLGAVLTDITLRDGSVTLRASRMKLGHPRPTPDGGISIRLVEVRDPFLQTPTQIVHGATLSLRKLVAPPSRTAVAGRSRIDIAHVALAHGQIGQLSVQNLVPSSPVTPVNVHSIFAASVTVDNYGPGLVTTLRTDDATIAYERTVQAPGHDPQLVSGQVSLDHLDLRQKDLAAQTGAFWDHIPLPLKLPPPERLDARNFKISMTSGTFRLDELRSRGTLENQTSTFTQDMKGFHFQTDRKLPFPINGAGSTAHSVQISSLSDHTSRTHATLTVPDLMTLTADIGTIQTSFADGHPSPQQVLQSTAIRNVALSFKGDRLLDAGFMLGARQSGNGMTPDQLRDQTTQILQASVSPNPGLAVIPDYVGHPNARTLTLSYQPQDPVPLKTLNDAASSPAAMMAFLVSPELKASAQ